ncbi:DNA polymerase III subunit gamma/tau [Candidatus Uhrbacteria bacterium]|nr:DNA polymerase III subunit gamma/tau [Candidatus Uhrbacteria bacterium]
MAQAIYRVYRPSTFKEVSGQEHVVRTLQNQFASGSLAHAYLFTGPRGVGKTTTARLIAKLANCESVKENEPCNACSACVSIASGQALDVYEIDAASHTGVENVRETVIDSVRFAPNILKKKVYIIDEVHMLSTSAFNALLKTLEEPPDHAMFVLATTEIHKVPETIISRCQRFDFKRIATSELVARMQGIVEAEGVKVDVDVLQEIARHSGGCARDAESLLGQVLALGEKEITLEQASLVLPITQTLLIETFSKTLHAHQAGEAITQLNTYLEQGVDLRHFVSDVISWLRDRLLMAVSGKDEGFSISFLQQAIEELLQADRAIRGENIPQLPVELVIVKICGVQDKSKIHPSEDFPAKPDQAPPGKKQGVVSSRVEEKIPDPVPFVPDANISELVGTIEIPENITEVEKVFDTVPVIGLEEVMAKWPQVYEQIKTCNASLPMMMRSCEVNSVEGEYVELGFEYDIYVQTVNQEKNSRLIEGIFEQVLGKRLRVRAVQTKKPEQDEAVQGLIQEFGGSLV